ncbi:RNA-binding protein [Swingsia samuiensis]|uniref:RNA-binding protein n=1 Tax=Swingsia samuiensis TaxID=1293412 RepID=UPI001FEC24E8|nr:RNA-binding protein [Swingsia samuiensis]
MGRRNSERRCMVTREKKPPEHLIRFVVGPNSQIVPDLAAKLPGRGMWLSASRDVLDSPRAQQSFSREAKEKVSVPDCLADLVEKGLVQRMLDCISLARRAGQVVCGFQKSREWITSGKGGVVIRSEHASLDEFARLMSGRRSLSVVTVPERILVSAFSRDRAVYAVMAQGALAHRLIAEYERFSGVAKSLLPDPARVIKEQAEL